MAGKRRRFRSSGQKAGLDLIGVTFVTADFEKEDWLSRLVGAGFGGSGAAVCPRGGSCEGASPCRAAYLGGHERELHRDDWPTIIDTIEEDL